MLQAKTAARQNVQMMWPRLAWDVRSGAWGAAWSVIMSLHVPAWTQAEVFSCPYLCHCGMTSRLNRSHAIARPRMDASRGSLLPLSLPFPVSSYRAQHARVLKKLVLTCERTLWTFLLTTLLLFLLSPQCEYMTHIFKSHNTELLHYEQKLRKQM
jgi:hypothetical protein